MPNEDITKIGRRVFRLSSARGVVATPFGSIASRNQFGDFQPFVRLGCLVSSRQVWIRDCSCATVSRS